MNDESREVIEHRGGAVAHTYSAPEIKARVQLIQRVIKSVMKEGMHFGKIPGTDKPTLYKAGSEVLLTTFQASVEPLVDDLSTSDEIRYRVRAVGRHIQSGNVIGTGIGEASSNEEKYKWRRAVCQEEFDETPEDRRRVKYAKGRDGFYKTDQVRTNPADVANTVLKMAKKRAQIDLTLTALAASDCFTQDLEDMPEELRESVTEDDGRSQAQPARAQKPATRAPQATSGGARGPGLATEKQRNLVGMRLDQSGIEENQFLMAFELNSLAELKFAQVDSALDWIKSNAA